MHDCDAHDYSDHSEIHSGHHHEHHNDLDDTSTDGHLEISQDECHICSIQLDFFEVPEIALEGAGRAFYVINNPIRIGGPSLDSELLTELRGPPSMIS